MQLLHIEAKTISDLWFQLIYNIFDKSYKQEIQKGSFEGGQFRLQYPGLSCYIEYPWLDMIPVMPPALGIPAPTSMDYAVDYFTEYLMNPELSENETYRYSSRIHTPMPKGGTQLERVISALKASPLSNQHIIEIGTPTDLDTCIGADGKIDPPCLRLLDFKVIPPDILTATAYFRSWDIWAGLPSNLAGIELLKEYIAAEAGLKNGHMYAYSAGAHIYGYQEELAKIRCLKK